MKASIAVIDDNVEILEAVAAAARRLNIECFVTDSPKDFIQAIDFTTELVIVDLDIPEFDGLEILRELSKKGYCKNIVIMSGADNRTFETTEALARGRGLVVAGRLEKAFTASDLDAILTIVPATVREQARSSVVASTVTKTDIESAIAEDRFEIHYQPQVCATSRMIHGFEALVRMRDKAGTLIFPDDFISIAESDGLIDEIGWIVARKAFGAVKEIGKCLPSPFMMSVNVSMKSLTDALIPERFHDLAKVAGLEPSKIVLEITESEVVPDLLQLQEVLARLRIKKFHLSIDDFGTGHAMMPHLQNIPANEIKIDKQFVQQLGNVQSSRSIVSHTIQLGHELGLTVVAEGVESDFQIDILRSLKCDVLQGYHFSKPVPIDVLLKWIVAY